ncbi:MAG TPA: S8 family serine peptidase, partial [Terriglobales bacterium]|nr:S8 family serine peptidase [Terriglobales bacterium]
VGEYSYVGNSAKDGFGHGTHCAGIAAAATNNDVGIAGMCPNCGILSVKVLDDQGSGFVSDVASGITYAASHGARVISLSLGGSGHTETLHSALDYAIANNALPVCAMGNSGSGSNTPEPAYWHDCLSVIATDQNGAKASFSNYGVIADVAAPGVAILSTMPTYPVTLTTAHGYSTNYDALSGTSMATPMVAGVAGLVLSQNPNLTPAQVAGIIEASSGDGVSWTPNLAFGVVNALKAVSSAIHSNYIAPLPNLVSPPEGATVSGLVTVQAAPTGISTVHHVDLVQNGTGFLQVLTGASSSTSSTGKGNKTRTITTPAWTAYWPSTLSFNTGLFSLSVLASDVFGNTGVQTHSFSIQNQLMSQSWTQSLCLSATSTCPSSVWFPVTSGVATQAAVHLQGTISYSAPKKSPNPNFGLNVFGTSSSGSFQFSCRVFNGATVDCYPPDPFDLYPDTNGRYSNYSGAELEPTSPITTGTVRWTLTYPQ